MLNSKCLAYKAKEQGKAFSDAELQDLSEAVPLAAYCIQCARRMGNKLEKFCWKSMI